MCVYLCTKFQVSSIILTSFRQGVILPPLTVKQPPKNPSKIRVSELFLRESPFRFIKYAFLLNSIAFSVQEFLISSIFADPQTF